MFRVKLGKQPGRSLQYRQYDPAALFQAFVSVKEEGMAIKKAARVYCIPETTLRERVNGNVHIDCLSSGPSPMFSQEQEARLVNHLSLLANVGYGYTRGELCVLATEYAAVIGLRPRENLLSLQWYRNFIKRWPMLAVKKPRSLSIARAKATSEENVTNYFNELDKVLTKYNLKDKPQSIYNIDEKGITNNHTPPSIVSDKATTPVAVTAGMSYTVTVLGAGNALGTAIPPYFIFPGKRMRSELMEGASVGAGGTVSDSGWSNGAVFQQYLDQHFLKFVQRADADQPILLLYDGHRSHISLGIIEWAQTKNIILFVLPPHTSHVLQPLDVGCFGPFQRIYDNLRHKFMRTHFSTNIPKHSVCELGCKAYSLSLTPPNLMSSFRKSGIYPFAPDAIDRSSFLPATVFKGGPKPTPEHAACNASVAVPDVNTPDAERQDLDTSPPNTLPGASMSPIIGSSAPDFLTPDISADQNECSSTETPAKLLSTSAKAVSPSSQIGLFFRNKEGILFQRESSTKKRKVLTAVVGGKPITEPNVESKIRDHISGQTASKKIRANQKETKPDKKASKGQKKPRSFQPPFKAPATPTPGPSGLQTVLLDSDVFSSDGEVEDQELCCVCKKWRPDGLCSSGYVEFTKWGQCTVRSCGHWVHLKYCTNVRVLRRHDSFSCPCHSASNGTEE